MRPEKFKISCYNPKNFPQPKMNKNQILKNSITVNIKLSESEMPFTKLHDCQSEKPDQLMNNYH